MSHLAKHRIRDRLVALASLSGMLLATSLAAQHLAANWINNGEFDKTIAGWTSLPIVGWDGSIGSPQAGSMRLQRIFSLSLQTHARQCFPAPLPMTGPYRLSARVLTASTPWQVLVESFASPACTGWPQEFVNAGVVGVLDDWSLVQTSPFDFVLPATSVQVIFRPAVPGEMWVDHVKFGALRDFQTVAGGPGDHLRPSAAQPWGEPAARIVVFEQRANTSPMSGDLYVARSEDGGDSWTAPTLAVAGRGRDSSPCLVQTGAAAWSLFHHANASSLYRIHRAASNDGSSFGTAAPVDLGWAPNVEQIGPHVVRAPDGSLTMTYQVPDDGVFIARSDDDGATWDQLRTQVDGGHSARVAYRPSDDTWLLVFADAGLWVKTTQDPYDWSAAAEPLSVDPHAADPYPVLLADNSFAVTWSTPADGAYQLSTVVSADGIVWARPVRHTDSTLERHNVHPAALPGTAPGTVDLYWAAAQAAAADYQIVGLAGVRATDELFADGFETP